MVKVAPKRVEALHFHVAAAAAGSVHSLALVTDDTVFSWG